MHSNHSLLVVRGSSNKFILDPHMIMSTRVFGIQFVYKHMFICVKLIIYKYV